MKTIIVIITSVVLFSFGLHAQTPTTEEQLNTMWVQSDHDGIEALLTTKIALTPPDLVAVHCAKFFYMFVKPDKTKALAAAAKLKQIADGSQNAGFIQLAEHEITEVQGIPDAEFVVPDATKLSKLHTLFPSGFPTIKMGVNLKQYLTP